MKNEHHQTKTTTTTTTTKAAERPATAEGSPPPPSVSPTPTTFSYQEGDDRADAQAVAPPPLPPPSKPAITRDVDRDTPGALQKRLSAKGGQQSPRKRSMKGTKYYAEVFSVREEPAIPKAAGVCVELKTNVILENEFDFAQALSQVIAKRYNQSEDAVNVAVAHSTCMVMGGTFDGTYILTISSVASISPTVNKRNAAVLADWFKRNLGVAANRGILRFVDLDFANYATAGETVLSLMEKEQVARTGAGAGAVGVGLLRELSTTTRRTLSRAQQPYRHDRSRPDPALAPLPEHKSPENEPGAANCCAAAAAAAAAATDVRKKRSMFAMFSRTSRAA